MPSAAQHALVVLTSRAVRKFYGSWFAEHGMRDARAQENVLKGPATGGGFAEEATRWSVVVVDALTVKILSSACQMSHMLDYGVSRAFLLPQSARLPRACWARELGLPRPKDLTPCRAISHLAPQWWRASARAASRSPTCKPYTSFNPLLRTCAN